jgi:WD40 repeat protein
VALSADGKMLASGDMDGIVRLWAANGMTPSRKLESKFHVVYSVAVSPDGQILAASGNVGPRPDDNGIMLRKIATAQPFGELLQVEGRQMVFSPDGKYLASPSGGKIVLWSMPDLASSQRIELQTGDKVPVNRLAFSPNLETLTLAAGGEDQVIRMWNITTLS